MIVQIAGTDVTQHLASTPGSVHVESALGRTSTAVLRFRATRAELTIVAGQKVNVHRIVGQFGGIVDEVTEAALSENSGVDDLEIEATCVDWTTILDRRLILKEYTDTTVGDIIDDLLTTDFEPGSSNLADEGFWRTYGTADGIPAMLGGAQPMMTGDLDGIESTIAATSIDKITATMEPVSKIFNDIAKKTGCVWHISPEQQIIMQSTPTTAGYAITDGTPGAGETAAVKRTPTVRRRRGNYRNTQYVMSPTTNSEDFAGDGTKTDFITKAYPMLGMNLRVEEHASDGSVDFSGDMPFTGTAGKYDIRAATNGEGWGYAGSGSLEIASNNAADTGMRIILGCQRGSTTTLYAGTSDYLNGTTWVSVGPYSDYVSVLSMELLDGSQPAGTIYVRRASDTVTIATATSAELAPGSVVGWHDATYTGYIGGKFYYQFSDDTSGTQTACIAYTDTSGNPAVQIVTSASGSATSETLTSIQARAVTGVYLGPTSASYTFRMRAQYEWVWKPYNKVISQSTTEYDPLPSSTTMYAEYSGTDMLYIDTNPFSSGNHLVYDTNASQVTARASAEGGTGIYDAVEKVNASVTTAEATTLASEVLARFDAFELEVTLETYQAGFRVGQQTDVTLSKHGLSAETLTIREVVCETTEALDKTSPEAVIWRLTLSSQTFIRDWVSWFRYFYGKD